MEDKFENLEGDWYGAKLTHIDNPAMGEYSLCGIAIDEIDVREKELFTPKMEYGSNCKDCIKYLRELREIKK